MTLRARLFRAAPLAVVASAVTAFHAAFHEPWRDEVGAVLEASAVPWSRFLHAMRLEGIPPLYHALLKVLTWLLPNHAALLAAGAIGFGTLLFGTYRLADSIARSKRAALGITLALSITYTYAYELGVMIRQYSLGLGLSFLAIACFREALEPPAGSGPWARRGTLAAAMSVLVSAHSACVAGAALLAFGLVSFATRRPLRAWWPVFLTLPAFALVVYLALPFPERTPETNRVLAQPPDLAVRFAGQLLVEGLMPNDWWRAESFLSPALNPWFSALRSVAFRSVVGALALSLVARLFGSPRLRGGALAFDLIAATAGCAPLLYIMIYRYWGSYRHQLFLGTPALVIACAWMLGPPAERPPARLLQRAAPFALAPWLALQLWMAGVNLLADHRLPFSDTQAAAAALPPDAHVIGRDEWQSAGIVFHRPDVHYRSPAGYGRPYRYTIPDVLWHKTTRIPYLIAEECAAAPESVHFAGPRDALTDFAPCATPLPFPGKPFGDHPFTWETFNLHTIDCDCVAGRAAPPAEAPLPPP